MNELIKEIAKQAYIADASKLPHWKFTPDTERLLKVLEGFNKEFAELIVGECIEVCNSCSQWADPDGISKEIKKHFGIVTLKKLTGGGVEMKERTKELAEQAGFVDKGNNITAYLNFNHEKFAELIVRECATLAYDGPNGILEHFGLGVEK